MDDTDNELLIVNTNVCLYFSLQNTQNKIVSN